MTHIAVPPTGGGHAAPQRLPQLFGSLLLTHALPQRWNPALHVKSQTDAEQVAVAFAGAVHGVQLVPHEFGLVFATHSPLQL